MKYFFNLILGGIYTLSFSPYGFLSAAFISIVFFILLLDFKKTKESILNCTFFSIGYFSVGSYWLNNVIEFYTDINIVISYLLVLIFILYLSLYIVIPVIIVSLLRNKLNLNRNFAFLIFFFLVAIFEIVRSKLFTGYSWFNFGQAALDSPLDYFFPVIGVHGLSLIIFIISLVFINLIKFENVKFFISILLFNIISYFYIFEKEWTFDSHENISVSIIQSNHKNKLSYSKSESISRMNFYFENTINLLTKKIKTLCPETKKIGVIFDKNLPMNNPDLIIWPESPIPYTYNSLEENFYKKLVGRIPENQIIVAGTFFEENGSIFNSIINMSETSNIYHKKHLVPFGEYLPLRNSMINLYKFLGINIYDIQPGYKQNKLILGNYSAFGSICYESIFSEESLISDKNIDFIINVSNDGWFGNSLAPFQHLDALRMRSLENQRYSIRAANTGISALISDRGEIIKFIPFNESKNMISAIKGKNGLTPIAEHGYDILYLVIFLLFIYSSIYFNFKTFRR